MLTMPNRWSSLVAVVVGLTCSVGNVLVRGEEFRRVPTGAKEKGNVPSRKSSHYSRTL